MKYYYNRFNNTKSNHGFTLIELMVVVGIVSALVVASWNGLLIAKQNYELHLTAHELEATLKNCQAEAFYSGTWYKMVFWPSINRYRAYRGTEEIIKDVQMDNIKLHHTNFKDHRVEFYPTGVPSMGGTVTLKTKYGKTLYVIMTPVTARTRVSATPPENW